MKLNDLSKKDLAVVGIRPLVDEATASAELADREAPKEAWEEEYWKEWGKLAGHPLANGLLGWIRSLISNQRRTIEHDLLEVADRGEWDMQEKQIETLKELMQEFKQSQGEHKTSMRVQLLAYLDGCLEGLPIIDKHKDVL